jgi:octopine/nopaline transport system permease protein
MDPAFLWDTLIDLLAGLPLTLKLASGSVALGAVLVLLLTAMRMSPVAVLGWLARIYVFVFRGTPLLVQIFLIYYGLGQFRPALQELGLWSFVREPYWCALAALTLNAAAYTKSLRG